MRTTSRCRAPLAVFSHGLHSDIVTRNIAAFILGVLLVLGPSVSAADGLSSADDGKDKLTGSVQGIAIHPVFGTLPFTDETDGQSDETSVKGGGTITFDFSAQGLGVLVLKYRYTCLSASGNVSIHRLTVIESSNQAIAPVGVEALSSVVDGKTANQPDTDRAVLFPPPPPPEGPCSLADRSLLDSLPVIGFTTTSGNWAVHDGLPTYP